MNGKITLAIIIFRSSMSLRKSQYFEASLINLRYVHSGGAGSWLKEEGEVTSKDLIYIQAVLKPNSVKKITTSKAHFEQSGKNFLLRLKTLATS